MQLSQSKQIILFRFHQNAQAARESIRILQHFNPSVDVHVLFGGTANEYDHAKQTISDLVKSTWLYPENKERDWKWLHTDLVLKQWYRDVGHAIDYDFVFSYEYDLLTLKPLLQIYPDIDDNTLALAACQPFTKEIENRWYWTTDEYFRKRYLEFQDYMHKTYGIKRQRMVSLGPGPLLPKKFLAKYSQTEDIDWIHDEIAYPAYGEALGFKLVDHGMHPGFGEICENDYFHCGDDRSVTLKMIQEQLKDPSGVRAFHPLKIPVTLDEILSVIAK